MKRRVALSVWCVVLSVCSTLILLGLSACMIMNSESVAGIIIACIFVGRILLSLFYMPYIISINSHSINIQRPFRAKTIPLYEVKNVEICPPTMEERSVCGSGGFLGYWGWFSEKSIGKYFAYYGKTSETFLVTLNDGRKYMLGSEDAADDDSYIRALL